MDLQLSYDSGTRVAVLLDGEPSHTFDRSDLRHLPLVWRDAPAHGAALHRAIFPAGSPAEALLKAEKKELRIIADDVSLQTPNWEYLHDGAGYLALSLSIVRVAPRSLRIPAPQTPAPLHILAVVTGDQVSWQRLVDVISALPMSAVLEPVQPPSLEGITRQLRGASQRVLHVVADAAREKDDALLLADENGSLSAIKTDDLLLALSSGVELMVLSPRLADVPSATNLTTAADKLLHKQVPVQLAMQYALPEELEKTWWVAFYTALANGLTIETAVQNARLLVAGTPDGGWAAFAPALFTCLEGPMPNFAPDKGSPVVLTAPMPVMVAHDSAANTLEGEEAVAPSALSDLEALLQTALNDGDSRKEAEARLALGAGYEDEGRPELAVPQYEQALRCFEELKDAASQAVAWMALGGVRYDMAEVEAALKAFEIALGIYRQLGDQSGEAAALNHLVVFHYGKQEYETALALSAEVSRLYETLADYASLASSLLNHALILVDGLSQRDEAQVLIRRSIEVMRSHSLDRDASGLTLQEHLDFLSQIEGGKDGRASLEERGGLILREDQQQMIAANTVAAMTTAVGKRPSWRVVIQQARDQAHTFGPDAMAEVAFLEAVLALLDDKPPQALPTENPYAGLMQDILQRIEQAGGAQPADTSLIPLEEQRGLIANTVAVLTSDAGKKAAWQAQVQSALDQARTLGRKPDVELFEAVLKVMDSEQAALPADHPYSDTLAAIQQGVEQPQTTKIGNLPEEQLRVMLVNTVAVLTTVPDKRAEWRTAVASGLEQAEHNPGWEAEAGFFRAVLAILDGNEAALPETHPYAPVLTTLLLSIEETLRQASVPETPGIGEEELTAIKRNTVVVMTELRDRLDEWRMALANTLHELETKGADWQAEADFFRAVVDLLDGKPAELPVSSRYAPTLAEIVKGVTEAQAALALQQELKAKLPTPPAIFPPDFVARCVAGLNGGQEQKRALFDYLQAVPAGDPQVAAVVRTMQRALLGDPLKRLGGDLEGDAAIVWGMVRDNLS